MLDEDLPPLCGLHGTILAPKAGYSHLSALPVPIDVDSTQLDLLSQDEDRIDQGIARHGSQTVSLGCHSTDAIKPSWIYIRRLHCPSHGRCG
ncbi:hypothetical protein Pst134EA_024588 [Puccinia striiformis f. sp. tritici]|uniref:hypothetical protein n=1 Tax=Puccinia striiformis f. sp. tritici TaxID=168172 RepID=UPI002008082B|nr:hypothetical protein Pst134EA_024588 [Puccinia striiformis f. sp. tritici]KAH9453726.1 hypothetical protein Pst134EA_024588 [Puccinia striiformis f. sp. tritici]